MLRLVEAPTAAGVSLDDAKAHLNVDFPDDDTLIAAYVEAAIGSLAHLNRALRPCVYALDRKCFADPILLPQPPLVAVESIYYLDTSGAEQPLVTSVYEVKTDALGQGLVRLKDGQSWPALRDRPDAVTITFQAGYETLPGPLRAAVLLIVGALYDQRAEIATSQVFSLPFGVDALVSTFRIWTPDVD